MMLVFVCLMVLLSVGVVAHAAPEIKFELGSNASGQLEVKTDTDVSKVPDLMIERAKLYVMASSGFALLTFVFLFVINIVKYVKTAENPQEHSKAKTGIVVTLICIAITGSLMTLIQIAYNIFK